MEGLITVRTRARVGGESEQIELQTDAVWTKEADAVRLCYTETPDEGEPTAVTVTARMGEVTVERKGELSAVMVFADGEARECSYHTPFGDLYLNIRPRRTQVSFGETGGTVRLWYDLENAAGERSQHEVEMAVRRTAGEGRA